MTLGPDGLVVNTAKYLNGHPLVAFNPDPVRVDGVLVPFPVENATTVLRSVLNEPFAIRNVTMARAELNDGQSIDAVNDLFIGQKTHVSARYRIIYDGEEEAQSSSGIIVSTGAGSTGWLRSVFTGALGVTAGIGQPTPGGDPAALARFDWDDERLVFSVREPFVSKVSGARIIFGEIGPGEAIEIVSEMPQNGVIFSDGIEEDHLDFNSGSIARIGLADRKLRLVLRAGAPAKLSKTRANQKSWRVWNR